MRDDRGFQMTMSRQSFRHSPPTRGARTFRTATIAGHRGHWRLATEERTIFYRVSHRLCGAAVGRCAPAAAIMAALLLLPAAVRAGFAPGATVHTETTRYTYNDDGALTRSRRSTRAAPTPPTSPGTTSYPTPPIPPPAPCSRATATWSACGPAPGVDGASRSFAFDRRGPSDRLRRRERVGELPLSPQLAAGFLDPRRRRHALLLLRRSRDAADDQHRGRRHRG